MTFLMLCAIHSRKIGKASKNESEYRKGKVELRRVGQPELPGSKSTKAVCGPAGLADGQKLKAASTTARTCGS
jgi:hypothetical protein